MDAEGRVTQEQLPRGLGEGENRNHVVIFLLYLSSIKSILKKRINLFLLTPPSPAGEGF
jgi:hypothetical protein